jgi:hypothetical protein
LLSAAGGRNEETYSGYAEGIPVEKYPSRRQHKQINNSFELVDIARLFLDGL